MRKIQFFLMGACLLAAAGCHKKEEKEVESPAPVQVTGVIQDTVRRIIAGDGVLYPNDQRNIMPKVSAPVQKFYANRGDHVKAGQLLATLENKDLAAAVTTAKGQVDQAQANLRTTNGATIPEAMVKAQTDVQADQQQMEAAQKLVESRRKLFEQGALARRQVDEAQVQYSTAKAQLEAAQEHLRTLQSVGSTEQTRTAQAQLDSARGQLQSAEAQLAYTEIRSDLSGVVADRPIYPGDMATTGVPLFTIVDISRVVARVNIPQNEATQVHVGQDAEITQSDNDQKVPGKVKVVSPSTDLNSTTVQVWIEIPNEGERLKPGASVHAAIVTEVVKQAMVVPPAAILPGEEGGNAVLVVADNIVHRRPVQLGVREGNKQQILSGVQPREDVVIVGGLGLDDKAKVKVVDTSVKEADEEDQSDEPAKDGKDAKKDEAKPKQK